MGFGKQGRACGCESTLNAACLVLKGRRNDRDVATSREATRTIFRPIPTRWSSAPAAAYLRHAIAPGANLDSCARITMHGHIKVGLWLPFKAEQIIDSRRGFRWNAKIVGGLLQAEDIFDRGAGTMRITLAGKTPIVRATGADITESALGRFVAERIWMPGNLLPDTGTHWHATSAERVVAHVPVDGTYVRLSLRVAESGALRELGMDRWGRGQHGTFEYLPFGLQVVAERQFGDFTIPSAGRVGWWYGTQRWRAGEFFRFMIDDLSTH